MDYKEERIDGEMLYDGIIVKLQRDHARLKNGDTVVREVIHHPGGVAILPVDRDLNCAMVRQYRYPFSSDMLEVPAGKLDVAGEDPAGCAVRELSEETGLQAGEWSYFGKIAVSPGISDEVTHIFIASDLTPGRSHPDEDEFLHVEYYPLRELQEMVNKGQITDAKSIVAILVASARYL